jgi:hypothetical protein
VGLRLTSAGVAIGERCAHGVDRNPRYEAREEEPGDTNPDRKCALNDRSALIEADKMEAILAEIDADRADSGG